MTDRFWGEEKDNIAIKQLDLPADYTIFMMANRGELIPDEVYDAINEQFDGELCNADEVINAIKENEKTIILTGDIHLVGMRPLGKSERRFTVWLISLS